MGDRGGGFGPGRIRLPPGDAIGPVLDQTQQQKSFGFRERSEVRLHHLQDRSPGRPVGDVEQRRPARVLGQPSRGSHAGDPKEMDYALEQVSVVREEFDGVSLQERR